VGLGTPDSGVFTVYFNAGFKPGTFSPSGHGFLVRIDDFGLRESWARIPEKSMVVAGSAADLYSVPSPNKVSPLTRKQAPRPGTGINNVEITPRPCTGINNVEITPQPCTGINNVEITPRPCTGINNLEIAP